jgi:hypothetical protein
MYDTKCKWIMLNTAKCNMSPAVFSVVAYNDSLARRLTGREMARNGKPMALVLVLVLVLVLMLVLMLVLVLVLMLVVNAAMF